MFSLVFVSVELNGTLGHHLSPSSLGEERSRLMAFPGITKEPPGVSLASRSVCLRPLTSCPEQSQWHWLPGPFLVLPVLGAGGGDQAARLLAQSPRRLGLWPSSCTG